MGTGKEKRTWSDDITRPYAEENACKIPPPPHWKCEKKKKKKKPEVAHRPATMIWRKISILGKKSVWIRTVQGKTFGIPENNLYFA